MKKLKNILSGIKNFFSKVHSKLPKIPPMKPETREKLDKVINFMNRFSIIFHIILACFLTFIIEFISRRDLHSTLTFMDAHTWAYLYNSLIIFVSLSIVYFFPQKSPCPRHHQRSVAVPWNHQRRYLSTACHTIWLYRLKDGH